MSWINSNATYKQNSKNDLSFYHGFSKTPVEPTSTGTAATTLANASTKGGHTVIGTEVWAEEIPWFGLVPSRAVAVTRLSGLAKLNDLVKVDGEGGKVYKYIGADDATFTEAQWSSFWQEVTLTNGMTLNNRHNQPVLRYYLNQPMQTLTTTNNASIDSKGYATRLFVNESDHTGQASGGSVVSQFAAGTDNIKNGIPSVELNPKLYYNTTEKIAGTHYYDYNVSGTVLWNENVTSKGVKISCFRYIGKTVTGQLSTVDSTVKSHALDIADIKLALGMNPNPDSPTTSVTARVETVEDVVRTLLGLGSDAPIAATESISATANSAATNAINSALADGGSIAQKITSAISALGDVAVKSDIKISEIKVKSGSTTTTLTPDSNKSVTVEIPEVQAAVVSGGVITTDGFAKASDAKAIAEKAISTSLTGTTDGTIGKAISDVEGIINGVSQTVSGIQTSLAAGGATAQAIAAAQGDATQALSDAAAAMTEAGKKVASVTGPTTGLVTVTGDKAVTITVSDQIATKSDADTAASTAITTSLSGTTAGTIGAAVADAKKAGTDAATAANAKVADVTVDGTSIVSGNAGSKTAALTTTKGVEITPSATSASTALATEASVAKALASINSVGVSYQVLTDGQTHTSITAPVNGRIYLEKDTTNAEAGVYIEWMYTEKGWEQIGSTKTDHSSFASTITVNGSPKTVANSTVDLGAFASSVSVGDGIAGGSVSSTGALSLTLAIASTTTAGITMLDSTIAGSTSETTAATPKAVKEYADTKVGDVQWFGENDILSTKAEVKDGKLVVTEQDVTNPNGTYAWNTNVVKVVNNEAFNAGGEKIATIETDKLKNGTSMFYNVNISEFASDMPLLEDGKYMFAGSALTQFVGDLPSLTTASTMFDRADIVEFIGDLSSLTNGSYMFNYCNALTTFISDLSSLTTGTRMFYNTNLSLESVECIADTINEYESDISISWDTLPAESKRQALVDELSRIVDKGWTLQTNQELLPLFDSEKYEIGSKTIQPLDLESEQQTVYYVVKK